MTSVGEKTDTGFLGTESRISFQPLSWFGHQPLLANILHNARWTAPTTAERLENVNLRQFLSKIWVSSPYLKVDTICQSVTRLIAVIISAKNNDVWKKSARICQPEVTTLLGRTLVTRRYKKCPKK